MTKTSPAGGDGSAGLFFAVALLGLTYLVMDMAKQLHAQRAQVEDLASRLGATGPIEGEIVEDPAPEPPKRTRKTTSASAKATTS